MNITIVTNGTKIIDLKAGSLFRYNGNYYIATTHTDADDNRDGVELESGALVTFPYGTNVMPVLGEMKIMLNNFAEGEFQW